MDKKVFSFLFILILLFWVTSCKEDKDNQPSEKDLKELKKENKRLKKEAQKKEESMEDFMQAFNEINQNLQIIKQKENLISMRSAESPTKILSTEKIKEDIMLIYKLLAENKQTVTRLRAKLEKTNLINDEMRKSLNMLAESIEQKNKEIGELRKKLESINTETEDLHSKLDSLSAINAKKSKTIDKQKQILNTGYYIIGTNKELYQKGITSKTGGIIGIGSVEKLDGYFDSSQFKKLNIHKKNEIELNCKKARLLSAHPLVSYKYSGPEGEIDKLIITRPDKFWSTSRYLVIEVAH